MTRRTLEVPEHLPLSFQAIAIMRCVVCGAIVPGMWQITRKTMRAGIDHLLDQHVAALVSGELPRPAFVNCAINDPFWFDEHAGEETP